MFQLNEFECCISLHFAAGQQKLCAGFVPLSIGSPPNRFRSSAKGFAFSRGEGMLCLVFRSAISRESSTQADAGLRVSNRSLTPGGTLSENVEVMVVVDCDGFASLLLALEGDERRPPLMFDDPLSSSVSSKNGIGETDYFF
ncbi:hypothetical protein U1Q18_001985 [Sarracenia purpurea var. burkii]